MEVWIALVWYADVMISDARVTGIETSRLVVVCPFLFLIMILCYSPTPKIRLKCKILNLVGYSTDWSAGRFYKTYRGNAVWISEGSLHNSNILSQMANLETSMSMIQRKHFCLSQSIMPRSINVCLCGSLSHGNLALPHANWGYQKWNLWACVCIGFPKIKLSITHPHYLQSMVMINTVSVPTTTI